METVSAHIPQEIPDKSRNHTFDFLRGLAILGVICVHCDQEFPTASKGLDSVFKLGSFGVQLFFFISALTMCYMWNQRENEPGRLAKFYIRRFLRIAPLFWLAIPIYLYLNGTGSSHWAPNGISSADIFLTAVFLQGFWPDAINSVVPGGWSIAVELNFYLVFPWLIMKWGRKAVFLYAAGVIFFLNLLVLAPLWKLGLYAVDPTWPTKLIREFLQLQFFSQVFIFLLGMHLYQAFWINRRMNLSREVAFFLGWFALMGIRSYAIGDARDLVALFWIICGYVLVATALSWKFRNRLFELLGRKSYSIYLSHFAMVMLMKKLFELTGHADGAGVIYFAVGFLGVSILSYLVATLFYYLAERPLHRLTSKFVESP